MIIAKGTMENPFHHSNSIAVIGTKGINTDVRTPPILVIEACIINIGIMTPIKDKNNILNNCCVETKTYKLSNDESDIKNVATNITGNRKQTISLAVKLHRFCKSLELVI